MNEQRVEQIERLAERLGLDGVAELCAEWRALKAENERLRVAGTALLRFSGGSDVPGVFECDACDADWAETYEQIVHAEDCPTRAFVQP